MRTDLPKLTARLALVAKKQRQGYSVCDVGTDHALLPIFLVKSGISKSAIASDINAGPLNAAQNNIKKYCCEEEIKTVLSDGLLNVSLDDKTDIIIAGMGGELIAEILKSCKDLHKKEFYLTLQPMTAVEDLREYLYKNNFCIIDEEIAREKNKLYTILSVKSCCKQSFLQCDIYFSKQLREKKDKNTLDFLNKQMKKYTTSLNGQIKGNILDKAEETKRILCFLKEIKDAF